MRLRIFKSKSDQDSRMKHWGGRKRYERPVESKKAEREDKRRRGQKI
jgi:ribosomal protein S21